MNQEDQYTLPKEFHIYTYIENVLFNLYIHTESQKRSLGFVPIPTDNVINFISEHLPALVLMQSDSKEVELLEISKRLKRAFTSEIKIILFSADYTITEEAQNSSDAFLQYPVSFEKVQEVLYSLLKRSKKVLLIDDSKLVHNHIVPPLKENGYEILEAFNGKEGLEMVEKHKPDLVICDIEMPLMNGFEVCAKIRKNPVIDQTYIIMSSTLGSASDIQKGFSVGVDEYIIKPVVISEMLDRIAKFFNPPLSGRENILVLEPEGSLSNNIAKSLKKQGFSSKKVSSIEAALTILEKFSYDVLISEMDIGEQTAMELWVALKGLKKEKRPELILLTSRDSKSDMKMIANMGASAIISKPFVMDSLLAALERVLADKRATAERAQLLKYLSRSSAKVASQKAMLNGSEGSARAEKKHAAIFFSDVAKFTNRTEKYPPTEMVKQLNALFEIMTQVIQEHEGDIDKFIGDACMAYWSSNDAKTTVLQAVKATLKIKKELRSLNHSDSIPEDDPIHIRIGIHYDEVILCDIGSPNSRIDLTIIGDGVNLASRLESISKQYGVGVMVSETIVKELSEEYLTREIDYLRVVGKNQAVKIYELIGEKHSASDREILLCELFKNAKVQYNSGNFLKAIEIFKESFDIEYNPESHTNPSMVFMDRCKYLVEHPPQTWDGIWNADSK
jgi:DNA-binding response OmpR family regulator